MKKWSIHYCPFDKTCREFGAPPRLNIGTPWGFLTVTIPPLYLQDEWMETGEYREVKNRGTTRMMPVVSLKRRASIAWESPSWRRPTPGSNRDSRS